MGRGAGCNEGDAKALDDASVHGLAGPPPFRRDFPPQGCQRVERRAVLPPSRDAVEAVETGEESRALRGVGHGRVLARAGTHVVEYRREGVCERSVVGGTVHVDGLHVCADDRATVHARAHLVARVAGERGIADDVRPRGHAGATNTSKIKTSKRKKTNEKHDQPPSDRTCSVHK